MLDDGVVFDIVFGWPVGVDACAFVVSWTTRACTIVCLRVRVTCDFCADACMVFSPTMAVARLPDTRQSAPATKQTPPVPPPRWPTPTPATTARCSPCRPSSPARRPPPPLPLTLRRPWREPSTRAATRQRTVPVHCWRPSRTVGSGRPAQRRCSRRWMQRAAVSATPSQRRSGTWRRRWSMP